MDIVKALRELYTEKKRLDAAIAGLETRLKAAHKRSATRSGKGRRGRKSMSTAERLEVSKRMTLYWEARRARQNPPPSTRSSGEDQQATTSSAS